MNYTPLCLLSILFLFSFNGLVGQLPPERLTNWSNAGVLNVDTPDTYVNVLELGFDNSGEISNSTLINQFFSDTGSQVDLYFPPGIYLFDQPINLHSGVKITGENSNETILLFDLNENQHCIQVRGKTLNTSTSLKKRSFKGDSYCIFRDVDSFEEGDWIRISDDDSHLMTSNWAVGSSGQIARVQSKAGDTLFINNPLRRDFSDSLNAKIEKLFPKEGVSLSNFGLERLDQTESQTSNILFDHAVNSQVECIQSYRCNFAHIDIRNSAHLKISDSYFKGAFDHGGGGKAYGVMLHFASSSCLIEHNIFDSLRHSMIVQAGANGNVFGYNYSFNPHWTGVVLPEDAAGDMVLHGNYPFLNLFEGNIGQNIVVDASHGINGHYNTFFRNRALLYGIFMDFLTPSNSQNFIGNEIINEENGYGLYIIAGEDHFLYGNNHNGTIKPNQIDSLDTTSLYKAEAPYFYEIISKWPPIGFPQALGKYANLAKYKYEKGEKGSCAVDFTSTNRPDSEAEVAALFVYPNPTRGHLMLRLEGFRIKGGSKFRVQVFNLLGKAVFKTKLSAPIIGNYPIDLGSLSSGVYSIRISNGKEHASAKVVVQ